jgi:hypothetical protein
MKIWVKNSPSYKKSKLGSYQRKSELHKKGISTIRSMIITGKIPSAKLLKCFWCDKQATEYHHHRGYANKYLKDVIPLCRKCHVSTFRKNINVK